MNKPEFIDIRVYNEERIQQYSFLIECVMDSIEFREVVDETLANAYEGWSVSATPFEGTVFTNSSLAGVSIGLLA